MPRVKITEAVLGRDDTGRAYLLDGASVQVNDSDGAAVTVYQADTGGTTITNPMTSDNGTLPGWLDEGSYEYVATYDGETADPVPFEARAAYPSGASDGDVLAWDSGSNGVEWTDPASLTGALPWTIDIDPFTTAATNTTWSTLTVATTAIHNGYRRCTAQNSEVGWDVVLDVGTWTVSVLHLKDTDQAIFTVSLDGVTQGTIDAYAGSSSANQVSTITGIEVSSAGKCRLLFKTATKNGSSSSYGGNLQAIRLLRTA